MIAIIVVKGKFISLFVTYSTSILEKLCLKEQGQTPDQQILLAAQIAPIHLKGLNLKQSKKCGLTFVF